MKARYDDFKEPVKVPNPDPSLPADIVLVSRDGNVPNGVPERTANLWLTYAFAADWRADAGARAGGPPVPRTPKPGTTRVNPSIGMRALPWYVE